MNRILVIDDEREIRDLVTVILDRAGMETAAAASGEEALRLIEACMPDLIILDIMMEERNGFEMLRLLRERNLIVPIILLSAKTEDVDKVQGFGLGADDYVTKPFSAVELVARVQAHLRRKDWFAHNFTPLKLECGIFRLETDTQILSKNGKSLQLSSTEAALLEALMKNPNRVFTKSQLFQTVWNHHGYDDNTLNVYINRIRQKIEDNPRKPVYLRTVWGIGYRFVPEGAEHEAEN